MVRLGVYAGGGPVQDPVRASLGEAKRVQTARPRDIGALLLVVGIFLVLFVVSLTVGSPLR